MGRVAVAAEALCADFRRALAESESALAKARFTAALVPRDLVKMGKKALKAGRRVRAAKCALREVMRLDALRKRRAARAGAEWGARLSPLETSGELVGSESADGDMATQQGMKSDDVGATRNEDLGLTNVRIEEQRRCADQGCCALLDPGVHSESRGLERSIEDGEGPALGIAGSAPVASAGDAGSGGKTGEELAVGERRHLETVDGEADYEDGDGNYDGDDGNYERGMATRARFVREDDDPDLDWAGYPHALRVRWTEMGSGDMAGDWPVRDEIDLWDRVTEKGERVTDADWVELLEWFEGRTVHDLRARWRVLRCARDGVEPDDRGRHAEGERREGEKAGGAILRGQREPSGPQGECEGASLSERATLGVPVFESPPFEFGRFTQVAGGRRGNRGGAASPPGADDEGDCLTSADVLRVCCQVMDLNADFEVHRAD
jgi:hypothetical protein